MKLLASVSPGEMRVAAWDGSLRDYAIHRPGAPDGVGDLHRGRIIARVPAMAGAFVALAEAEGFLPDSEGANHDKNAGEGTILGVRITRAGQGGAEGRKGPRLTARLSPPEQALVGTGPPALLRRGPDALSRLAELYPDAPILIDDPGTAATLSRPARIVPRAFDDDIEAAIAALSEPSTPLPGGAWLHVFPTPALTALDVDLAGLSADRSRKPNAQFAANRALLPSLARQIRLRNLSGAILVDLAGMALRKRAALGEDFTAALSGDPLAPRFLGFSALGLAEILRPRIHPPLHEMLEGPHAAGLAGLRALAREIAATPSHPPVLHATRAIATVLRADTGALDSLAARAGRRLVITEHHALPAPGWSLEDPSREDHSDV